MANNNQDLGQMSVSAPIDAVKLLAQLAEMMTTKPVGIASRALGAYSTIKPGEVLQGNMSSVQNANKTIGEMGGETSYNPVQETVLKAVKKNTEAQVNEAMQQGVPAEHILTQSGIMQPTQQAPTTENVNKEQPVNNANVQPNNNVNILQQLLGGLFQPSSIKDGVYIPGSMLGGLITEAPSSALLGQQRASMVQKAEGNEPIQKGELEKINVQGMIDLQKELAKKGAEGLQPAQATAFSALMEGRQAVTEIDSMLNSNFGGKVVGQYRPSFFKSQEGRQLESAIERAIQLKTRAETGAAMQPSELKSTVKRYAPRIGESHETFRKRIAPLFDYFNQSIAIADPTGIHEQRAQGARQRFTGSSGSSNIKSIKQIGG